MSNLGVPEYNPLTHTAPTSFGPTNTSNPPGLTEGKYTGAPFPHPQAPPSVLNPPSASPPNVPTSPNPPSSPTLSGSQQDAWAIITSTLQAYGFVGQDLTDLTQFVKGELINGTQSSQIQLDLEASPQFARRFPAIIYRRQNNLPPISPSEYLSLQTSYQQLEQSAGLTPNMFNSAHWDSLIANDVSPTEYATRINQGYVAATQADPSVKAALFQYYNIGPGDLTAFFLDPAKALPAIQQKFAAAQIGGAATRTGFGDITSTQAERLAQNNITGAQAQQGFQQLTHESQLTHALPGQAQTDLSNDNLLAAQFTGDQKTADLLAQRAEEQKDYFKANGQFGTTQTGVTGTGTVTR